MFELHAEAKKRHTSGRVDGMFQQRDGSHGARGRKAWLGSSYREVAHMRMMSPGSESYPAGVHGAGLSGLGGEGKEREASGWEAGKMWG